MPVLVSLTSSAWPQTLTTHHCIPGAAHWEWESASLSPNCPVAFALGVPPCPYRVLRCPLAIPLCPPTLFNTPSADDLKCILKPERPSIPSSHQFPRRCF